MLKKFKQVTLQSLKSGGVFRLVRDSGWRGQRLLILAYHGLSLEDEHLWDGSLYMEPAQFRRRMELLKRSGCAVLPLGEAVERMYAGSLPERCVALTFDDGTYDFYREARPVLSEFNFPATVYLTTFYSNYPRPVFDVACSYLLWKGRGARLDLGGLVGRNVVADLADDAGRRLATAELRRHARENKLSAEEKDALAGRLAERLKLDYEAIAAKRLLSILSPEEVTALASEG